MTQADAGSQAQAGDQTSTERVAVVTGGNRGIGLEICRQLSRLGHHVVLTARDERSAEQAASGLAEEGPGLVVGAALDVCDEESVASTFAEVARNHGSVDVLVNNAGIAIDGPAHRATAPDFSRVEETLSTTCTAHGAVPWRRSR